jgi:hypothetical protein
MSEVVQSVQQLQLLKWLSASLHRAPLIALMFSLCLPSAQLRAELQVGAARIDVSPDQMPVLINGGMTSRSATEIKTRVNARAIVIDDGGERIAIVVVDSCMMPRDLLDEAKQLAATRTGLKPERILISATHTHTAPSSMGALGTDADPNYVPLLRQRLVEALVAAEQNMKPARVGWGSGQAPQFTALRRWVRRPDRIDVDPFGNPTVRANMHSARDPEDAIGPTGPEDPELSIIAFETLDGAPIAALANFSMHYFGDSPISSDYFGLFCDGLEEHMRQTVGTADKNAVAIMSHGCSGDIWKKDYFKSRPEVEGSIQEFSQGLLHIATQVYDAIEFQADADVAMAEARLPMRYRTPDAQRLQWAQQIVADMGERLPKTTPEVYAREQVILHELQSTEVVVQALRIGDIAITTTPNETYALTGLKLKLQSPLAKTMVIELANGGDGYIPPPEQHFLGGYNTWAARSAGLETSAEPRIVAAGLSLLEEVSGQSRRPFRQSLGPAADAILQLKPIAYWRLDEMSATAAYDATGNGRNARFEAGTLFFLEGPPQDVNNPLTGSMGQFSHATDINRCVHFAGGRLVSRLPELSDLSADFTISMMFWNGMPKNARPIAGWMFSHDHAFTVSPSGIHLGLAGAGENSGRLVLQVGENEPVFGTSQTPRWNWNRAVLVKQGNKLSVFQSDPSQPEVVLQLPSQPTSLNAIDETFFGGRSDNSDNWEGKLDEIAIFDRGLSPEEIAELLE